MSWNEIAILPRVKIAARRKGSFMNSITRVTGGEVGKFGKISLRYARQNALKISIFEHYDG